MASVGGQNTRPYGPIDLGVISRAWPLFAANWQKFAIAGVFIFAPMMVLLGGIFALEMPLIFSSSSRQNLDEMNAKLFAIMPVMDVIGLIFGLFFMVVDVCICRMCLAAVRTGQVDLADFYGGFKLTGQSILAALVNQIGGMISFLFCCVGAFVFMGCIGYMQCGIADGLPVTEAIKKSWEMTKFQIMMAIVLVFVLNLIGQIGTYACYIGFAFSYPFGRLCTAMSYVEVSEGVTPGMYPPAVG